MAMGIIMAKHLVTEEEAFMVLRLASQHTNRKLADVAANVVATGVVPETARSVKRAQGDAPTITIDPQQRPHRQE